MAFRIPKIKTFCCCTSLQTGSYVIAVLNMMAFFLTLSLCIRAGYSMRIHQMMSYYTVFINIGAFTFHFLYGLTKADPTLIFPWILQMGVFTAFVLNMVLCNIIYLGLMDYRIDSMAVELLGLVITCYCLLVVYNHYRALKEASTECNVTPTSFAVSNRNVRVDN